MYVVTGDIFYDAAAAFGGDTFASYKFQSKQKISRGAVELAQRAIDPGSNNAAHGGLAQKRNRERKELTMLCERFGNLKQRCAGFDTERQVAGIVGDDCIQRRHVEREIVAPGR